MSLRQWLRFLFSLDYRRPPEACSDCERCTWNPGPDCGIAEHPHCSSCSHCMGRHEGEKA